MAFPIRSSTRQLTAMRRRSSRAMRRSPGSCRSRSAPTGKCCAIQPKASWRAASGYAGSEGLSVLVIDARAFGGQAGASMRIENYLGFPTGISGQALAGRAYAQAQKFGAQMLIPIEVRRLDCEQGAPLRLELGDGRTVRTRTVV